MIGQRMARVSEKRVLSQHPTFVCVPSLALFFPSFCSRKGLGVARPRSGNGPMLFTWICGYIEGGAYTIASVGVDCFAMRRMGLGKHLKVVRFAVLQLEFAFPDRRSRSKPWTTVRPGAPGSARKKAASMKRPGDFVTRMLGCLSFPPAHCTLCKTARRSRCCQGSQSDQNIQIA